MSNPEPKRLKLSGNMIYINTDADGEAVADRQPEELTTHPMTPYQINSAIAKTQGWTFVPERDVQRGHAIIAVPEYWEDSDGVQHNNPPNYYDDLNLMRDVFFHMPEQERLDLTHHLSSVGINFIADMLIATPRQYAELYLRYKNLWIE